MTYGDRYLLQTATGRGLTGSKHQIFNACWQAIQVSTLLDITSANGESITLAAWTGNRRNKAVLDTVKWPPIGNTNTRTWGIWQHLLTCTFQLDRRNLPLPLGDWVNCQTKQWKWWYAETEDQLYKPTNTNTWNIHSIRWIRRARRCHHRQYLRTQTGRTVLPAEARAAPTFSNHTITKPIDIST
jgi:hypothetical protein